MTNLEYLSKFLTETFGAICFHNDVRDGYVECSHGRNKKIETLAIYFPNEIDMYNEETRERLIELSGKEFYKRYIGAKNTKMSVLNGSTIVTRFILNNKTIGIEYSKSYFLMYSPLKYVIDYFLGENIDNQILGKHDTCEEIKSNTSFRLRKNKLIKDEIEAYLTSMNLPLVTRDNGFYIAPVEEIKTEGEIFFVKDGKLTNLIADNFLQEKLNISKIKQDRDDAFVKSLQILNQEDWKHIKRIVGGDKKIIKNSEFDD